jgi:hypothetical protein
MLPHFLISDKVSSHQLGRVVGHHEDNDRSSSNKRTGGFGILGPLIVSKRSARRVAQPGRVIALDPEHRPGGGSGIRPISLACRLCWGWGTGIVSKRSIQTDVPLGPVQRRSRRRSIYCRRCRQSGHGIIMRG